MTMAKDSAACAAIALSASGLATTSCPRDEATASNMRRVASSRPTARIRTEAI
jgi:hypothetical protein